MGGPCRVLAMSEAGLFSKAAPARGVAGRAAGRAALRLDRTAPWARFTLTPLRRGAFAARLLSLDLGDTLLEAASCPPAAAIGCLPPDRAALLVPLSRGPRGRFGGAILDRTGVLVLGPGAAFEAANRAALNWAAVLFDAAALARSGGPPPGSPLHRAATMTAWRLAPEAAAGLTGLLRDALAVARRTPAVFAVAEARRSLRASLIEALHEVFDGATELPLAPAPLRRIVQATDRMVAADAAHAADLPMLAGLAGTTAVGLSEAFGRVLGLSAARFVLHRRLALAR